MRHNDPEAGVKLYDMAYAMINAPKNSVFLCQDESTFRLLPVIRSMWMKVGQQLRIVVPSGWNKCFRIFGALNVRTGHGIMPYSTKLAAVNSSPFWATC